MKNKLNPAEFFNAHPEIVDEFADLMSHGLTYRHGLRQDTGNEPCIEGAVVFLASLEEVERLSDFCLAKYDPPDQDGWLAANETLMFRVMALSLVEMYIERGGFNGPIGGGAIA